MHKVHIYTCWQNTHTHKIKQTKNKGVRETKLNSLKEAYVQWIQTKLLCLSGKSFKYWKFHRFNTPDVLSFQAEAAMVYRQEKEGLGNGES